MKEVNIMTAKKTKHKTVIKTTPKANKQTVIERVAKQNNISVRQASIQVNNTLDAIVDVLVEYRHLTLRGFGRFELGVRQNRMNRVVRTGKRTYIEKRITVRFNSPAIKRKFQIPQKGLTPLGYRYLDLLEQDRMDKEERTRQRRELYGYSSFKNDDDEDE